MKKVLYSACAVLLMLSVLFLCSCSGVVDYEMTEYTTGALKYAIPSHFVLSEHDEADAYYMTLNSEVAVYSYTHDEFDRTFGSYNGNYKAGDVAEFLVTKHGYQCSVPSDDDSNRAIYSFMFCPDGSETVYYYTNAIIADEENIAMLSFSCLIEKLDEYSDMITEIIDSLELTSSIVIG